MLERLIINHCSPTLAGLKTGNMFNIEYDNKEVFRTEVSRVNRSLAEKGVRLIPLRQNDKKALIYLYRPGRLAKDLTDKESKEILDTIGYDTEKDSKCLIKLIRKLESSKEFPHEIGLFLGYPPKDVKAFIDRKEAKLSGYWKVYDDVEVALKTFKSYQKCFKKYKKRYELGYNLESLTISI